MLRTAEEAVKEKENSVGAIVGRFQVADLTEGHKSLFDTVIARHQKMICVIGLAEIRATKRNTLDFEARRKMISEIYPDVDILYIKNDRDDRLWSKKLDNLILTHIPPNTKVTLYGSRDSFTGRYFGNFDTKELLQESFASGTAERSTNAFKLVNTSDSRKGAIWTAQNQYDFCYPCVNVALMKRDESGFHSLLLGKKHGEKKYSFVGGFIKPSDKPGETNFLEKSAKYKIDEKTHVESADYVYLGSAQIDDWRYRDESNKIVTTLFKATYVYGSPEPDCNMDELRWFDFKSSEKVIKHITEHMVEEHIPLLQLLCDSEFGKKN